MKNQNIPPLISRAREYGSILGLKTIQALLRELDNPQDKLQIIHIAGTNGKGSIASFFQGMLMENNYQTGLFTSPYFQDPREMIQHNGVRISEKDFGKTLKVLEKAVENMVQKGNPHPTEFEIYVAAAFYYFARVTIDFLVLEVGLGGREDATNVIKKPVLSVISQIGLDHTRFLGNTLKEIAEHKGGIVKDGIPVIVYPQEQESQEVLQRIASDLNSPFFSFDPEQVILQHSSLQGQCFSVDFSAAAISASLRNDFSLDFLKNTAYTDVKIRLPGKHQVLNAATALLGIRILEKQLALSINAGNLLKGLYDTKWPGRFEVLNLRPLTVIDGAHNVPAVKSLRETLKAHCGQYSITLLLGMLEDKDVDGFLQEIMPLVDRVVLTKPLNPRALNPMKLKEKIRAYGLDIIVEPSIYKACLETLAITGPSDMILGIGSLYMIGEAREVFLEHFNHPL